VAQFGLQIPVVLRRFTGIARGYHRQQFDRRDIQRGGDANERMKQNSLFSRLDIRNRSPLEPRR